VAVVDIGGTHLRLGWLDQGQLAEESQRYSTDVLRVAEPVEALAQLISGHRQPEAVVIGMPAVLDTDFDEVLRCNNLPQLVGIKLKTLLAAALDCPVYVEHDIMLQLLGEMTAGAAQGERFVLGVFMGTGIGAGFVHEGRPFRRSAAGLEIGHIPIRKEGKRCICGNTDCLEAYASGHVLADLAERYAVPVAELFMQAHPDLQQQLAGFVEDHARAVATAVALLDPELVLLGGGIPQMAGYPHEHFETTLRAHLQSPYPAFQLRLAWASLGQQAAPHGALSIIKNRG
jgi:allose kinase